MHQSVAEVASGIATGAGDLESLSHIGRHLGRLTQRCCLEQRMWRGREEKRGVSLSPRTALCDLQDGPPVPKGPGGTEGSLPQTEPKV